MLTIKHIDTDGTETLMEAERVEVVRGKGHFEDGIFLDNLKEVVGQEHTAGGCHVDRQIRRTRHPIPFVSARSEGDTAPRVYVMNRFGATVATYHL